MLKVFCRFIHSSEYFCVSIMKRNFSQHIKQRGLFPEKIKLPALKYRNGENRKQDALY